MKIYLAGVTNKFGKGAVEEERKLKTMGIGRLLSFYHITITKDVQPDIVKIWFEKKQRKNRTKEPINYNIRA